MDIRIILHVYLKGKITNNINKSKLKILSYGTNKYDNMPKLTTTHAEIDAINNLIPLARNKKLKKISILVIKTTHSGKIGSSKPCLNCLTKLSNLPQKKGYVIKDIIYSNVNEQLEKHTLNQLINSDDIHITKFYRKLQKKDIHQKKYFF